MLMGITRQVAGSALTPEPNPRYRKRSNMSNDTTTIAALTTQATSSADAALVLADAQLKHVALLRSALRVAASRAAEIEESYTSAPADDDDHHVLAYSYTADKARDAARDALRNALVDDDIPRQWIATDETGSVDHDLGELTSDEALEAARDWAEAGDYDLSEGTVWLTYRVRCPETDEDGSIKITLEPEAPECSEDAHDWQSPIEIVGGIRENPGVWGHGGGVIVHEVCMHCGCERTTDTWAQDMETGEQGLTSIAYEQGKYADEIDALRETEDCNETVA